MPTEEQGKETNPAKRELGKTAEREDDETVANKKTKVSELKGICRES
jgi:hypothetical protein